MYNESYFLRIYYFYTFAGEARGAVPKILNGTLYRYVTYFKRHAESNKSAEIGDLSDNPFRNRRCQVIQQKLIISFCH